jgi:hypothetical protein
MGNLDRDGRRYRENSEPNKNVNEEIAIRTLVLGCNTYRKTFLLMRHSILLQLSLKRCNLLFRTCKELK